MGYWDDLDAKISKSVTGSTTGSSKTAPSNSNKSSSSSKNNNSSSSSNNSKNTSSNNSKSSSSSNNNNDNDNDNGYDYSKNTASYGYNPYNGNYYGDGTGRITNSNGDYVANVNSGATYKDTTVDRGWQGSQFARSDNSYKSNYDIQMDNVNSFIDQAKSSGRSQTEIDNAVKWGEAVKRALENNEDMSQFATWRYDGRGFAYNGNISSDGREYSYDPYTGAMTGNAKLADPNYSVAFDPAYNYIQDYASEKWNSMYKELVDAGQLDDNADSYNWLMQYKDKWIDDRVIKQGDKNFTTVTAENDKFLTALKSQMQYYNNQALSANQYSPVSWSAPKNFQVPGLTQPTGQQQYQQQQQQVALTQAPPIQAPPGAYPGYPSYPTQPQQPATQQPQTGGNTGSIGGTDSRVAGVQTGMKSLISDTANMNANSFNGGASRGNSKLNSIDRYMTKDVQYRGM